jgi:hypothetical protein
MATGEDWHRWEVELAVEAYLRMLLHQRLGRPFVKLHVERDLARALEGRSKGSVSRKFMNISFAIHELGAPSVNGYKPLPNLQHLIREVLSEKLARAEELNTALASEVSAEIRRGDIDSLLGILEEPPEADENRAYERVGHPPPVVPTPGKNWLEVDQARRELGLAGELLVLEFEDARLRAAGHARLANRIDHVAKTVGDGLGYDVLSFDVSGRERLIEVKTTRFGKYTPFFATTREVSTSVDDAERFHLYRVHSFEHQPRLYQLPGSLWESCVLDPVVFKARPGASGTPLR